MAALGELGYHRIADIVKLLSIRPAAPVSEVLRMHESREGRLAVCGTTYDSRHIVRRMSVKISVSQGKQSFMYVYWCNLLCKQGIGIQSLKT